MNQKGFANIILVIVVVVLLGAVGYFALVRKSTPIAQQTPTPTSTLTQTKAPASQTPSPSLPTACKDEQEGTPVITSLSGYSGSIGTKLEIRGCNFSGFEGDKNAWIVNSQGVKGLLYGEAGSTSKLLKVTFKSPLCQKDTSYSGLPCDASLTLTPGVYKIYVMPWGKESNKVSFTINTDTITVKVYLRDSNVNPIDSCGVLVPVTRVIPKTEKVATAAIAELLKGPTSAEKSKGYSTDIPSASRLNSLTVVNGEARADFSSTTESGGSCNLTTDQIRKTLLQFSTVKTVTLSVDGRTENIFQP